MTTEIRFFALKSKKEKVLDRVTHTHTHTLLQERSRHQSVRPSTLVQEPERRGEKRRSSTRTSTVLEIQHRQVNGSGNPEVTVGFTIASHACTVLASSIVYCTVCCSTSYSSTYVLVQY